MSVSALDQGEFMTPSMQRPESLLNFLQNYVQSPATKNHLGQNVLRMRNLNLHKHIYTRIYTNQYEKPEVNIQEAKGRHPNKKSRFPVQFSI